MQIKNVLFVSLVFSLFISCSYQKSNIPIRHKVLKLDTNWHIINSAATNLKGNEISRANIDLKTWYNTDIPSTVMATLVHNCLYDSIYIGKKMLEVPAEQFKNSWWYRKEFQVTPDDLNLHAYLIFEGINYRSNVWLNGKKIASADTMVGAFRRFKLKVKSALRTGKNILAVEVFPPRPGDFTIGFVDWNPKPPDNNMGIWRPVKLVFTGQVSITDVFVQTKLKLKSLKEADVTISAELTNSSQNKIEGYLICDIEKVNVKKRFSLNPFEHKTVVLNSETNQKLHLKNPRLWWPNNLGEPNLYNLQVRVITNGYESDKKELKFGIREIATYFNEKGHRGFKVNGKSFLIKGGGWVNDLLLSDSAERLETQIKYVKDMNLNTIRLEGFWGTDQTLYDLCDKYGILVMVGWSCQWEWEEYLGKACDEFGGIKTREDMDLILKSWNDQIKWLRNHPSIFVWLAGSDKLPRPALEKKYLSLLKQIDPDRPYLASAGGYESEVSGPTGVKMNGPYAYTPPVYWFEDRKLGGGYGFNTETGPGPQVPILESIKKMIPPDHLWPIDDVWEFHCGRNNFQTLDRYVKAMNERYGRVNNVEDFAKVAQVMNFELIRPMFEAFEVNKKEATGIIQWMLNSAWPEMYWQLYDYELIPTGAYYGTKIAAHPLHLIYNYFDKHIYLINDYWQKFENLNAEISMFNISSEKVFSTKKTVNIGPNSARQIISKNLFSLIPENKQSKVYFLNLLLSTSDQQIISRNFYWLSTKEDIPDYKNSEWYYTPTKQYADFTELRGLPQISIQTRYTVSTTSDGRQKMKVVLRNPSKKIGFFIELKIVGKNNNKILVPVFWSDNYISLLPEEERVLWATFDKKDLQGDLPVLKYSGWNVVGN